jgi:hypothetical protein
MGDRQVGVLIEATKPYQHLSHDAAAHRTESFAAMEKAGLGQHVEPQDDHQRS